MPAARARPLSRRMSSDPPSKCNSRVALTRRPVPSARRVAHQRLSTLQPAPLSGLCKDVGSSQACRAQLPPLQFLDRVQQARLLAHSLGQGAGCKLGLEVRLLKG